MREFQHKNLNFKLRNERSRTRCWPKFIRWECSTFLPHFEELLHNFAPWNWKWIFSSLASLPFWNFRFSCGREDDNFPGFFLLFTSLHPLAPNRWSLFYNPVVSTKRWKMPSNSQRGVVAGFVVVFAVADSHKAIYFYCLDSRERKLANLCTERSQDGVSALIWSRTQPKLYSALNSQSCELKANENSSFIFFLFIFC